MRTSFISKFTIIAVACLIFIGCKDKSNYFTIEGKISDADSTMLYLERRTLTETQLLDSVKLQADGSFKFEQPGIGYPEFYLLRLKGQTINLAIDSTETIDINASAANFGLDYTIEGSNSSVEIKEIVLSQNKLSNRLKDLKKEFDNKKIESEKYVAEAQEAVDEYKSKARDLIYANYNNLSSYFALFQKVDDYLIFDPHDKKDLALFQAVATVWDQQKAQSPRTTHLKDFTLKSLAEVKYLKKQEDTLKKLDKMEAVDNSLFYNIELPDINNKNISLSSLQGKVVILDFTVYKADFSPAHNIQTNNVYSKYKENVEVYQVSFDSDKHAWQNSVINLPWICVRDQKSLSSELMTKFNLQGLPTTFIVNKKGEIVKRMSTNDNLETEVRKLL